MNLRIGLAVGILLFGLPAAALIGFDPEPQRTAIDLKDRLDGEQLRGAAPKRDANVYLFGFDRRANPVEDARQYGSFLAYLSKATGYRFELRFVPADSSLVDELGRGRMDLAAVGAGTFLKAKEAYGVIPLARGLNRDGQAQYQSVIVVPPWSRARKVADLKGKRFAFGDFNSTQGHLIPRIVLAEHGIGLPDLAQIEYTGSHRNCANAVAAGRFDAGGMQDLLGREMQKAGLLRILETSRFFPSSGIAARKDLPPAVLRKVSGALLDFQPGGRDAAGLYHWNMTEMAGGFVKASPEDYEGLRTWAIRMGMIATGGR